MRRPTALALIISCFALAACGGDHEEVKLAEVEGVQVTVNHLEYQVQISRILNAANVEDAAYLSGVPASQATLPDGSEWFAVFVRAKNNDEDEAHVSADGFLIEDTVGTEYRPVEVDNPFAYEPAVVEPGTILPSPESAAGASTVNGALLLFKITRASLENRPLEFIIKDPKQPANEEEQGIVDLDV